MQDDPQNTPPKDTAPTLEAEDVVLDDVMLDEDFEDMDDFSDDDFDDEALIDLDDAAHENDGDEGAVAPAAKEKSFLQKYFYGVVGAVVVLFGGLFLLAQGGGGKSPAPPESTFAEPQSDAAMDGASAIENEDMPPQPSAMQSDVASSDHNSDSASGLTPMPDLNGDAALEPLPPLAQAEETSEDVFKGESDIRSAAPVSDIEQEPLAPRLDVELGLSGSADTTENAPANITFDDNNTSKDLSALSLQADAPAPQAATADIAALEQEAQSLTQENTALEAAVFNKNSELSSLNSDITALKAELETARTAVADFRAEKNALSAEIEAQKDVLAQLEAQQENAKQAAAVVVAPKKVITLTPVKPVQKTVAKATPKASPAKAASQKIQWALRAAQPGQASIAPRGSNELKTVRVGDSVDGLGRIQSIAIENGKWVVRGTKGLVTQ
ncbi:MAG: hypothetical protein ACRBCT_02620 [Alphaproteobacteria bacterium]